MQVLFTNATSNKSVSHHRNGLDWMYISAVKEKDNTLMYVINKTISELSESEWVEEL